jgi:nucleotide-binding universal stress UspA family protein
MYLQHRASLAALALVQTGVTLLLGSGAGPKRRVQRSMVAICARGPPGELGGLREILGADMLVIGNKGMGRRVLGSVPDSVAHKAPCSVLVVKTT